MKIAIYDFCDTLVDFQTADEFVRFTQKFYGLRQFRNTYMSKPIIGTILSRSKKHRKSALLLQLRGLSKSQLGVAAKEYYQTRIKPSLHKYIVDSIAEYHKKGYRIVVLSAAYSIYLEYFAKDFGVDDMIANDFLYHDDRFTGCLTRKDCRGMEKISRLEEVVGPKERIEHSVCYSDSKSDIPILKWADESIVVSKFKHRNWVDEMRFKEIVLTELEQI